MKTPVLIALLLLTCLLIGCSRASNLNIYKSNNFNYSFSFPNYLHIGQMGPRGISDIESLHITAESPVEGITMNIINIDKISDLYSEDFYERYRKFIKEHGIDNLIIVPRDNSVCAFFKEYYFWLDCKPFLNPLILNKIPAKEIAISILKSLKFTRYKIKDIKQIESDEEVDNLVRVIGGIATKNYYNHRDFHYHK